MKVLKTLIILFLILSIITPSPIINAYKGTISVSKIVIGKSFTISGKGWRPNVPVIVTIDLQFEKKPGRDHQTKTDNNGNFRISVTIKSNDLVGGRVPDKTRIYACSYYSPNPWIQEHDWRAMAKRECTRDTVCDIYQSSETKPDTTRNKPSSSSSTHSTSNYTTPPVKKQYSQKSVLYGIAGTNILSSNKQDELEKRTDEIIKTAPEHIKNVHFLIYGLTS